MHGTTRPARALRRRLPALVSVGPLILGIVGTAARLDAPADGTVVDFGGWAVGRDGVAVTVPGPPSDAGRRSGDVVAAIAGHRLGEGAGALSVPDLGSPLLYTVLPDTVRTVQVVRQAPGRCWHAAGETWSACWPWDGWRAGSTSGGPTSRRPVPCSSLPGAGPDLTVVQPMPTQGSWDGVIEGLIRDLAPADALPG